MTNSRRITLKNLGLAGGLGLMGLPSFAQTQKYKEATKGLAPVKITKVRAIVTCPHGTEFIVVKVETSEPGLYGLGCATFRQRAHSVVAAIDKYLNDFCLGRDVDNIEDIWQATYQSSYWRNGPVLNNALSGLDQALWDIKGKRANMPVYQLLGGKCRFAIDCYTHVTEKSPEDVVAGIQAKMKEGFRHFRIKISDYGINHSMDNFDRSEPIKEPDFRKVGFGMPTDGYFDSVRYAKSVVEMFRMVRDKCGEKIELLHDIHERIEPMGAIRLIKELEEFRPFFIEDPFSPENNRYFKMLRQQSSVPIAMGELFNSPHEWVDPMKDQLFDFIRIHISQIGGITPAMKVARLGEFFNVRTAWHGPGDLTPVGHAANAHIDFAVWNFGIQEAANISDRIREIFPGSPYVENGYMYVNEAPGLGVDINEQEARKYPLPDKQMNAKTQVRKNDGTINRP